MQNEDVKIGMKVVPFQKTVCGDLQSSVVWNRAKNERQPFLYVVDRTNEGMWELSRNDVRTLRSDYYNACDFEPYTEKKVVTKNIKHIITGNKTIVVIQNEDGTYLKGEAKCNPQDEFNEYEGFRVAYSRAIGGEPFKQNTTVKDTNGNKKKIIDNRIKIDTNLWEQFLYGHIAIRCETETHANRFLNVCKTHGITWENGAIATQYNHWKVYSQNTCYALFKGYLIFCDKRLYLNTIVNYQDVFNRQINQLSQFANEELLEEVRIRLNK